MTIDDLKRSGVGMMSGAFFAGKRGLLEWVNQLLDINLKEVEQCASGLVYCMIMDALYPGKLPLRKLNWQAVHPHEFTRNFKVLQEAFDRFGVSKNFEPEKLMRGKLQDNLEFLQWFKSFYDSQSEKDHTYNARDRRAGLNLPAWAQGPYVPVDAMLGTSQPSNHIGNSATALAGFGRPRSNAPTPPGFGSDRRIIAHLETEIAELREALQRQTALVRLYYNDHEKIQNIASVLDIEHDPADSTSALESIRSILGEAAAEDSIFPEDEGHGN